MANGNRTTLTVAVAGIAATALVGVAGTAASWLSARDDRTAQRELARDERTYDRRVAACLDAIDFFEKENAVLTRANNPSVMIEGTHRDMTYPAIPPTRLTTRLHAFGSTRVSAAFDKTLKRSTKISGVGEDFRGPTSRPVLKYYISLRVDAREFFADINEFAKQVTQFENVGHGEIG